MNIIVIPFWLYCFIICVNQSYFRFAKHDDIQSNTHINVNIGFHIVFDLSSVWKCLQNAFICVYLDRLIIRIRIAWDFDKIVCNFSVKLIRFDCFKPTEHKLRFKTFFHLICYRMDIGYNITSACKMLLQVMICGWQIKFYGILSVASCSMRTHFLMQKTCRLVNK